MNASCLLDYSLLAAEKPHEVTLMIRLTAPEASASERKPLHVALVLDRSSSMAGEKLEKTKEAAALVIQNLTARDWLSVVIFESGVETLVAPGPVTNRQSLLERVAALHHGGMTNLSGGWLKGIEHVGAGGAEDAVRRILLMTDGQANQGITNHDQLVGIGNSAREQRQIVTTTLGFGKDFDEDLLTSIARHAGGNHYYIESTEDAPEVFSEELGELLTLVAQNIEVKVSMAAPIQFMAQWTDYPATLNAPEVTFRLGDAHATTEKTLVLGLFVPGLQTLGPVTVATVEVRFSDIGATEITDRVIRQEVRANIADAGEADQAEPEIEVLQQLGLQMASKARREAIREADKGDYASAQKVIEEAVQRLKKMPGDAAAKLREEIETMLSQRERTTPSMWQEGTRKQMSSDAYNISSSSAERLRRSRERRDKRPPEPDGNA
jgi:Ca-activated chloride channel homolog